MEQESELHEKLDTIIGLLILLVRVVLKYATRGSVLVGDAKQLADALKELQYKQNHRD